MSVEHYENFPVASWLCPPSLRPAVRAIYTFARTADDIADEGDAPAVDRLAQLAAYRHALHRLYRNEPPDVLHWPQVFGPLANAVKRHRLPLAPLDDLLDAFAQDVAQPTYTDRAELLDYCRRSAHPVGRLLLHLYGIDDALSLQRSDAICAALQLANFWQDLSVDTRRGRLYVPLDDCQRHGVPLADLLASRDSREVRSLMRSMVDWARGTMLSGAPLACTVPGRAGWELRLVVQGGLRILERIERSDHAALTARPTLDARDAPILLWRALAMRPAPGPQATALS